MADEYIKIAIATADQKKEHENLAPQEIARTTTPPHCLTYSVCTTHLPSQLVSFNFNTASSRTAGKFYRSLRHRLLARGSIHGRALPFLTPLLEIYKSLDYRARENLARFVIIVRDHCKKIPHIWYIEKSEFQRLSTSSIFSSRMYDPKLFIIERVLERRNDHMALWCAMTRLGWRPGAREKTTSSSTTSVLNWTPSDWTSVVFDESGRACAYAAVTYIATEHVLCTYRWWIAEKTVRTCMRTHCEFRYKV